MSEREKRGRRGRRGEEKGERERQTNRETKSTKCMDYIGRASGRGESPAPGLESSGYKARYASHALQ